MPLPQPVPARQTRWATAVALVTLIALTCLGATAAVGPSSAAASARETKERQIRACVNRERRSRGLAPLQYDRSLSRAARLHANNMRTRGFFDHTDHRGRGPSERVRLFTDRFSGAGENIYGGPRTAGAVCAGWMRSAGHRANFLNRSYRFIGTGYAAGGRFGHYWVQNFATAPRGG